MDVVAGVRNSRCTSSVLVRCRQAAFRVTERGLGLHEALLRTLLLFRNVCGVDINTGTAQDVSNGKPNFTMSQQL